MGPGAFEHVGQIDQGLEGEKRVFLSGVKLEESVNEGKGNAF